MLTTPKCGGGCRNGRAKDLRRGGRSSPYGAGTPSGRCSRRESSSSRRRFPAAASSPGAGRGMLGWSGRGGESPRLRGRPRRRGAALTRFASLSPARGSQVLFLSLIDVLRGRGVSLHRPERRSFFAIPRVPRPERELTARRPREEWMLSPRHSAFRSDGTCWRPIPHLGSSCFCCALQTPRGCSRRGVRFVREAEGAAKASGRKKSSVAPAANVLKPASSRRGHGWQVPRQPGMAAGPVASAAPGSHRPPQPEKAACPRSAEREGGGGPANDGSAEGGHRPLGRRAPPTSREEEKTVLLGLLSRCTGSFGGGEIRHRLRPRVMLDRLKRRTSGRSQRPRGRAVVPCRYGCRFPRKKTPILDGSPGDVGLERKALEERPSSRYCGPSKDRCWSRCSPRRSRSRGRSRADETRGAGVPEPVEENG